MPVSVIAGRKHMHTRTVAHMCSPTPLHMHACLSHVPHTCAQISTHVQQRTENQLASRRHAQEQWS